MLQSHQGNSNCNNNHRDRENLAREDRYYPKRGADATGRYVQPQNCSRSHAELRQAVQRASRSNSGILNQPPLGSIGRSVQLRVAYIQPKLRTDYNSQCTIYLCCSLGKTRVAWIKGICRRLLQSSARR